MITVVVNAFNQKTDKTEKVGDIIWDGSESNERTSLADARRKKRTDGSR